MLPTIVNLKLAYFLYLSIIYYLGESNPFSNTILGAFPTLIVKLGVSYSYVKAKPRGLCKTANNVTASNPLNKTKPTLSIFPVTNHHAFPNSALLGIHTNQSDPGWWVLLLRRVGPVWNVKKPQDLPLRPELVSIM
jgi:hypothetical protein